MKLHLATLLTLFTHHAKAHEPLDYGRLLSTVVQMEGATPFYVSPSKARGIYQIKPATWAQYSKRPHTCATTDPEENARVAREHTKWIVEKAIPALGMAPTAYSFALLWFPGYGNVRRRSISEANDDFGKRFEALYQSL